MMASDFYRSMRQMAEELLAPTSQGGLGQGTIALSRQSSTPGANPWDPPVTTTTTETMKGAVRGVSKELIGVEVGGTVVLASDRQAICAPPSMGYTAGDTLVVDGVPVHIVAVQPIPAAGVTSAIRFIIRG